MNVAFFLAAILLISIAHLIRIKRWELFIDIYEKPNKQSLLQSMAIGYLLNYIIPFKLGDVIRAWLSGKKMKNGKALGFSTVIADRYLDILSVGIIYIFLSASGLGGTATKNTATFYIICSILLLFLMFLVYTLRSGIKKVIRTVASIFNEKIESSILRFFWALIWNFKDIFFKISKLELLFTTISMWLCYILSYAFFANFLQIKGIYTKWTDIFTMLFAENGIGKSTGSITLIYNSTVLFHPVYMICYMVVPSFILIFLSLFFKKNAAFSPEDNFLNLLPHLDPTEQLNFLESYFSNTNQEYINNYLKINQNVSIIRDYSAGSNATTMLCMDGKDTFFRKYAFGEDGQKLYQQILWLEDNKTILPLPTILRQQKTDVYCFYDMPYRPNAVGLFEYSHSMPIDKAWNMIQKVLESLESSIYQINVRPADAKTIRQYIEKKVTHNIEVIKSAKRIKALQQYDYVIINGAKYKNLNYYQNYLSPDYLYKIFQNDTYATIHGDLTIENIICTRDENGNDDFYIIDPNTGNLHDSPNLDYGKLLQSIHGGYEFLMTTKEINVSENKINFLFTKSSTYIELHNRLREYMQITLGFERTRSIYFHEIIHWLRLMPYKIEKDGKRALLFYSGLLIVLNDVIEIYGVEQDKLWRKNI